MPFMTDKLLEFYGPVSSGRPPRQTVTETRLGTIMGNLQPMRLSAFEALYQEGPGIVPSGYFVFYTSSKAIKLGHTLKDGLVGYKVIAVYPGLKRNQIHLQAVK